MTGTSANFERGDDKGRYLETYFLKQLNKWKILKKSKFLSLLN